MQSYPSPNAVPADAQPFYASSGQQPPSMRDADELQLTAQLSRSLAPTMSAGPSGNMTDGQDPRAQAQGVVNHQYEHEQEQNPHPSHVQHVENPMDQMGNQYGAADGSMAPRKRSKVSRACDECRRKKIRCDATGEQGDEQCSSCKRVGTRCQFSRVPMKRGPSKGYIKELADRLNTLEGAMQSGEIPVQQYLQHHDSPMQRRVSEDYSPPPNTENPRKRTFSSVSGDFNTPYMSQRAQGAWPISEATRMQPAPAFSPPQPSGLAAFREPNYSPNGLHAGPQWSNPPDLAHRPNTSVESLGQVVGHVERTVDVDDGVFASYHRIIHPIYPILSLNKTRLSAKLQACPPILEEAFCTALHAAVRSFPGTGLTPADAQAIRKAAQLLTTSQFEGSMPSSNNLVHLQTLMLLTIAADNIPPDQFNPLKGPPPSVWLGSAVGLAYSLKLHESQQTDLDDDPDSDAKLMRRIWWALVIMDRWHSSSISCPLLIPEESVIVRPEDLALLGDSLYHIARLSIVLGHLFVILLEDASSGALPRPGYGLPVKGELDRCIETLPPSFFPPSNSPLFHLCYWHIRTLVTMRIIGYPGYGSRNLLEPTMHTITQLLQNTGLISPLTSRFTTLATLALLELTNPENSQLDEDIRREAESGLRSLFDNRIAPSTWDPAIRDTIAKREQQSILSAPVTSMTAAESKQAAVAAQGLQHLADLATRPGRDTKTGDEMNQGEVSTSGSTGARFKQQQPLRELIRDGYLSAFTRDAAR